MFTSSGRVRSEREALTLPILCEMPKVGIEGKDLLLCVVVVAVAVSIFQPQATPSEISIGHSLVVGHGAVVGVPVGSGWCIPAVRQTAVQFPVMPSSLRSSFK